MQPGCQNASKKGDMLLPLAACWVSMRLSALVQARIGTLIIIVLSRVLAMLLAAFAMQFIFNGGALFIASPRQ
jgi:small neutral amino acid transporter SnatA (MarC family)